MTTCIPRVDGLSTDPRVGVSQVKPSGIKPSERKRIQYFYDVVDCS